MKAPTAAPREMKMSHGRSSGVAKRPAKWTREGWLAHAAKTSGAYRAQADIAERIAAKPWEASGDEWTHLADATITPQNEPIDWAKVSDELRAHAAQCRDLAAACMHPPAMRYRAGGWKVNPVTAPTPKAPPTPGPATWDHRDSWIQRGEGYRIEVSCFYRENTGSMSYLGPHHWAVYAYVYPSHPLFAKFSGTDLWQPATEELPLHGGCTFLQSFRNEKGEPVSWQVGCDYSHLHDDHFSHLDPQFALDSEVFQDATHLAGYLARSALAAAAAASGQGGAP